MRNLFALLAGSLFGAGLLISGMTDTTKVQGWLDLFGAWDPTLAFVLGGAIIPMAIAWAVAEKRDRALLGDAIPARPEPIIDRNLIIGSGLFGMGWALSGLCPGPAMAVMGMSDFYSIWIFMGSLIVGMGGWHWFSTRQAVAS